MINADVRDADAVTRAARGADAIHHLAFVNGTEFFYTRPEFVLDVGVKGIINVLDAAIEHEIREFVLASSSEVYQTPPVIPTPESVPLSIPDPLNPRYSYAAGKIISEIMAINYGRKHFDRTIIFRPHNVYGPDMGWEHVIPQFALRVNSLMGSGREIVHFPIQGDGSETRAFIYIDDFVDGLMRVIEHGENLGIYHIGTTRETSIAQLAKLIGENFECRLELVAGEAASGGTHRRCPDIRKLAALGFTPRISLERGIERTVAWYREHANLAPQTI